MKIFIFGAGASYASNTEVTAKRDRSPLTSELLNDEYLVWGEEVGFTKFDRDQIQIDYTNFTKNAYSKRETLESYLTSRWEQISKIKTPGKKQSEYNLFGKLHFYIWNLLRSISLNYQPNNLYNKLISKVAKSDIEYGLIDFNYDVFPERVLHDRYGWTFWNLDDYLHQSVPLIKPHGSVNWFLPPQLGNQALGPFDLKHRYMNAGAYIYGKNPVEFSNVKIIDPSHNLFREPDSIIHNLFNSQYFFPLMLLPTINKEISFVNNFPDGLVYEAKTLLTKASEIYLIGYRAADDIIGSMLSGVSSYVPLWVINRSKTWEIVKRIQQIAPQIMIMSQEDVNMDFESFIDHYT